MQAVLLLWRQLGRSGKWLDRYSRFPIDQRKSFSDPSRYRQKSDVMPKVVTELFPSLVTIASNMLQTPPSASQEIPTMLHLILKTYKTSIVINLSQHQQSSESIVPWGQLLFAVINLQIPKEAVPEDEDDRERSEWWKAKKWAYGTLGRLFHR